MMAIATTKLRLIPSPSSGPKKVDSALDLIGDTPLVEIHKITEGIVPSGVRIFSKLEGFNLVGLVKDRTELGMVQEGGGSGNLLWGYTILDYDSVSNW